jgi:hypothetical protein
LLALTLLFALLFVTGFIGRKPPDRGDAAGRTVTVTRSLSGDYRGVSAAGWAARYRHRTRQLQEARAHAHDLRRVLLARPSVAEAINLAAAAYRVDAGTLWRKARCESHLNPLARNASEAAGLFQFIPSTFASTPFARFSIWSAYANALAAGWMHSVGRGGEWVCR